MIKKIIALIGLTLSVCANAATVTVGGTNYDIATVEGVYSDIEVYSILQGQVWWSDSDLANEFATALGTDLGNPNQDGGPSTFAPFFVWADNGENTIFTAEAYNFAAGGVSGVTNSANPAGSWTYATATVSSVPLPAAAWLFGSALFGLVTVARSKQLKA